MTLGSVRDNCKQPSHEFQTPQIVGRLGDNYPYYMAESVFATRLVNFRSVTCFTDQNFKENAHFGALNLFTWEKKVEIKLQDVYEH